jgi:hypothetical protein
MRVRQTGKHKSLVQQLRTPIMIDDDADDMLAQKLNEIAEALAYLVDKEWAKRSAKKVSEQIREERERRKHVR